MLASRRRNRTLILVWECEAVPGTLERQPGRSFKGAAQLPRGTAFLPSRGCVVLHCLAVACFTAVSVSSAEGPSACVHVLAFGNTASADADVRVPRAHIFNPHKALGSLFSLRPRSQRRGVRQRGWVTWAELGFTPSKCVSMA